MTGCHLEGRNTLYGNVRVKCENKKCPEKGQEWEVKALRDVHGTFAEDQADLVCEHCSVEANVQGGDFITQYDECDKEDEYQPKDDDEERDGEEQTRSFP